MLFVGLLADIKAVSHTATTVPVDVTLTSAFLIAGLCQSIIRCPNTDAMNCVPTNSSEYYIPKVGE